MRYRNTENLVRIRSFVSILAVDENSVTGQRVRGACYRWASREILGCTITFAVGLARTGDGILPDLPDPEGELEVEKPVGFHDRSVAVRI